MLKQVRGSDLAGAVRIVASGRSLLNPRAASKLMTRLQHQATGPGPLAGLTPHEYSVLSLIGEGLTNRQIGERLFISEKTVRPTCQRCSASSAWSSAPRPPPTRPVPSAAEDHELFRWQSPGSA